MLANAVVCSGVRDPTRPVCAISAIGCGWLLYVIELGEFVGLVGWFWVGVNCFKVLDFACFKSEVT